MKKVSVVFVIIVCMIMGLVCNVEAYSTSNYSIDIPSTYNKVSENSFTNENGKNINIQIVPYRYSTTDNPYTEEHLEEIVKGLYTEVDKYREEMKKMLQEKNDSYGAGLTENEINEYVKSFKCNSVVKKEICTFTENNYKGFHIVANYSMGEESYYVDQYMVASGKNIYTLSITCSTLSEVDSVVTKNIVNSFKINNFQPVKGTGERVIDKILTSFFSCLIICGIGAIIGKTRKNKEDKIKKNNSEIVEEIKDKEISNNHLVESNTNSKKDTEAESISIEKEKNIEKRDEKEVSKKFCTNCGKEIEDSWVFCNHCGFKLK